MRLFIATTFPDAITGPLNERVGRFRSRLPPASWVRAEAQHLTFAFLGEQKESLVATLAQPVESALAGVGRFDATLRGGGFFPNPRRARIGWVGVEPQQQFVGIANAVRAAVKTAGVELDSADFRPHLTLMRLRDGWPPASIKLFESALHDFVSEPFLVDHVTLYSSRLDPKGAIHTPLRAFPLS
jgi:RNA 2',3'-cyclic 3'-phosphodiesterase